MDFATYASEVIKATKLCIEYGIIDEKEAARGIENIIKRYGRMHRDIELAIESMIEFKKRLEDGRIE